MLECLAMLCIFGILYAYAGYPLVLMGIRVLKSNGIKDSDTSGEDHLGYGELIPAIIITARNEASALREKLENTLSLQYRANALRDSDVEIIVASDASDDDTDSIALEYAKYGVKLVRIEERRGKEFAQSQAVKHTNADIILFTDAKTSLASDALVNCMRYFGDTCVGAVSSVDKVVDRTDGEGSGEGFYVRYEMWLRDLESDVGSLVGLSGSCFAVRRSVCENFRTDIPSDFALLLQAKRLGYRGVLANDMICSYLAVKTHGQEFRRKVRTVLRGITTLFACKEVLNPFKFGFFAFQLISHKLFRWLVPYFMLLCGVVSLIGAGSSFILAFIFLCAIAICALASVGAIFTSLQRYKVIKVCLFFLITNMAILVSWFHFFRGQRTVQWTPSAR